MEYPKYCILAAHTVEQANWAKQQLHDMGIKLVWTFQLADNVDTWLISVILGDEMRAYALWKNKFGTLTAVEAFKAAQEGTNA